MLTQAYPLLRRSHVSLVGVDTEDSSALGAAFARQRSWRWPEYDDQTGATLHAAGFAGLPDAVITQNGRIVGYFLGPITTVASLLRAVSKATGHT